MGRTKNFEGSDMLALRCIKTLMDRKYGRIKIGQYQGDQLRLVTETKLIWAGKNYVMVREGPCEGTYDVTLYNRDAVFLKTGNPGNNAMMEIALATIDPVHKIWVEDYARTLWRSGKHGGGDNRLRHLRGRRFGKKLVAELAAFAEFLDANQEERLAEFKQTRADQRRYANSVGKIFVELGVPVQGRDPQRLSKRKLFTKFVPAKKYSAFLGERPVFHFTALRNEQIEVKLDSSFTKSEFEFLAQAVAEIHKNRMEGQEAQKDIA